MILGITPNFNTQNNISFKGIAMAKYSGVAKTGIKPLTIYKLEPRDLDYLKKLYEKVQSADGEI